METASPKPQLHQGSQATAQAANQLVECRGCNVAVGGQKDASIDAFQ